MTSRSDAAQRKRALTIELLADIAKGELRPSDQIAGLDTLSRRYGLSKPTVLRTLRPLLADGTLRAVPSVGIFVAHATPVQPGCYVILVRAQQLDHRHGPPTHSTVRGFEERISQLGGESLVLGVDSFLDPRARAAIPTILGVFAFSGGRTPEVLESLDQSVPCVQYLAGAEPPDHATGRRISYVDLDNESGGRLAAGELLRDGYRDIVFLGLHTDGATAFPWSRQRAEGWRQAMVRHHPKAALLCVLPDRGASREATTFRAHDSQTDRARSQLVEAAAHRVLDHEACIGADDTVLAALAARLRDTGIARDRWPRMVGFEGLFEAEPWLATSIRPRWSDLGAVAADHVFDAARGKPPRTIGAVDRAPMVVIKRPPVVADPQFRDLLVGAHRP